MKKLLAVMVTLLLMTSCTGQKGFAGVWNNYDTAASMGSSLELTLEESGKITAIVGYRQQCEGTFTATEDGFTAEMELTFLYSSSVGRWLAASGSLSLSAELTGKELCCTLVDEETGEEYCFTAIRKK